MFSVKHIKFLHCADIHLDMPFTSLGNCEIKAKQRRGELRQAFQKITALAVEHNVDMLLVCGDLYEHQYASKSTANFLINEFNKISNIKVIIVPGNHDPDVSSSFYRTIKWPVNVHILSGETSCLEIEEKQVFIFTDIEAKGKPLKSSNINIFMAHGTLDMNIGKSIFNPLSSERLSHMGMDYIALGHFHNVIEKAGRKGIAFNPGSPEPLGFDEEGSHGVFIADITGNDEVQLKVDFVPINSRTYRNLVVQADGFCTDEESIEAVKKAISSSRAESDLFTVTIKGLVDRNYRIDKKYIENSLEGLAYFIRIKDDTAPDYDFNEISKEPGIKGLFVKRLLEKAAIADNAGDDEGKKIIMKALYYGMEAIEQGKICI